jgi:hypothetical protein
MSIAVMKQALEALDHEANKGNDNAYQCERDALRAAIEQAEKPMAWFHADNYKTRFTTDPSEEMVGKYWKPLYTAPRQEPYDQTSLELCEECGWKAIIPGDGCLVCARQKAKPIAWMYDFLSDDRDEVIRDWVTQSQDDIKRENGFNVRPLYTVPPAAPKPYRRGTYVRCMESDELCRVWTTSIDGGAWVKWPDGSITTYTAEQMGQAFSLEQAAPGKPVAYVDERIHGWPDCFVMEPDPPHTVPLYTEPQEWVELTDDEARALVNRATFGDRTNWQALVYMVDAKLKEKNHAG